MHVIKAVLNSFQETPSRTVFVRRAGPGINTTEFEDHQVGLIRYACAGNYDTVVLEVCGHKQQMLLDGGA